MNTNPTSYLASNGSVEPAIERFTSRAQELAERGWSAATDASVAAQRQLGNYAGVTRSYVSDQPVKAALFALAVGAAIAALLLAARSRSR